MNILKIKKNAAFLAFKLTKMAAIHYQITFPPNLIRQICSRSREFRSNLYAQHGRCSRCLSPQSFKPVLVQLLAGRLDQSTIHGTGQFRKPCFIIHLISFHRYGAQRWQWSIGSRNITGSFGWHSRTCALFASNSSKAKSLVASGVAR